MKIEQKDVKTGKVEIIEIILPDPTPEELEQKAKELRKEKMRKLRDVRDEILNRAAWISQRWMDEEFAVREKLITENDMKWKKQEFIDYLYWKKYYADIPDTIKPKIDSIDINTINAENKEIFKECPIQIELNKL